MTTIPFPTAEVGHSRVPCDLAGWLEESELLRLALEASAETEDLPGIVRDPEPGGEGFSGPMLLSLLLYAYARGVLSAVDITGWVLVDPWLRYLCGGRVPGAGALRWFRRRHRAAIVRGLGRLLREAGSRRRGGDGGVDWAAESVRRVERAVRIDSMVLDD